MAALVGRIALVLTALGGAYVVALWFVLAVWTFRDIESRSRSVVTQVFSTLMVVLFFVPGVLLYLILRPKETLDEAFQRTLEEEYLLQDLEELPLCSGCHRYVDDDFVLCPHCHAQLREPCVGCSRLVDLRWALCPYCGSVQDGRVEVGEHVETPAARWTAPALRRRRVTGEPVVTADALVATSGSPAGPSLPRTEVAVVAAEDASELGEDASGRSVGTVLRPFGRFKRDEEAATAQASAEVLYGATNGDLGAPASVNGNGRPLAKRGRFTRATTNGRSGWSSEANGHVANGREDDREHATDRDLERLEPLSTATREWPSTDEEREAELVDAGRGRT